MNMTVNSSTVNIAPSIADSKSTITVTVDNSPIPSSGGKYTVSINGVTTVTITVTAEDTASKTVYTLKLSPL
jgi:carbon monoxide dehydrogenase subunit G